MTTEITQIRKMENQSLIKIGDQVTYNGLGGNRVGTVTNRTKRTVTIKFMFSTLKLTFKESSTCNELGLKIIK